MANPFDEFVEKPVNEDINPFAKFVEEPDKVSQEIDMEKMPNKRKAQTPSSEIERSQMNIFTKRSDCLTHSSC